MRTEAGQFTSMALSGFNYQCNETPTKGFSGSRESILSQDFLFSFEASNVIQQNYII